MATPDRKLFPPGSLLGELRIVRLLSRGTNGDTYLVREQSRGVLIVLRALHADRFASKAQNTQLVDALKALAGSRHPNAVSVLGAGEMGDRPYYLLEWVDGETLRHRMRSQAFLLHDVERIGAGVAAALADAHKRTVFHHDLKPDNVLLGRDGSVKVLELGIARAIKKALSPVPAATPPTASELEYMAPEQVKGDAAAAAADVWALGAMMFEMLSSVPPYQGRVVQVLADQISGTEKVRRLPTSVKAPAELSEVVYRCLEKGGAQRPTSAEVAESLKKALALPPPTQETNPFRGLFPYTEADAAVYFGREEEAAALLDRIAKTPVVTLTGPSGAGKTSFVNAALLPRLRLDSHVVIAQTLTQLIDGLADDNRERPPSVLVGQRSEKLGRRVTIVADEPDAELLGALHHVASDRADIARVLIVIEDKRLAALATREHAVLFGDIAELQRPTPAALKAIIERTAAVAQHGFDDPGLPDAIVDALQAYTAPLPLLAFAFETLWVRRDQGSNRFTRAAYDADGGISGMIGAYGESAIKGANEAQLRAVRDVFLRLETGPCSKDELVEGLGKEAPTVVERLVQSRLLIAHDGAISIVHPVLAEHWPLLRQWLDEKRSDLSFLNDIGKDAAAWKEGGERAADTYQGQRLKVAQERLSRVREKPAPDIPRFLDAGQRRATRKAVQRRTAMAAAWIVVAGFAVLALLRATIAYKAKQDADDWRMRVEAERADAQREDARSATMRLRGVVDGSELVEARAQVRASLEHEDSTLARALWGELVSNPQLWQKHIGGKPALAFAGKRVAAASGRAIHVLDAASAEDKLLRGGHEKDVSAVAFTGADALVSGDQSGKMLLWNLQTGASEPFADVGAAVSRLDASADGQWLTAATRDDVRLFTVASKDARMLKGASRFAVFSADGALIAAPSGEKGAVQVFDTASGEARRGYPGHPDGVVSAAFGLDGTLVTGGREGEMKVWGATPLTLTRHDAAVNGLAYLGDQLISASADGTLQMGPPDGTARRLSARAPVLGLRGTGHNVVTSTADGNVQMWSTAPPSAKPELRAPEPSRADLSGVGFLAGAFVAAGEDGKLTIWDLAGAAPKKITSAHAKRIISTSVSPDGKMVATGSADGTVRLTALPSGEEIKTFAAGAGPVVRVHIVDKKTVLSGHSDGRIRAWNIANGKARIAISAYSDRAIAFSPDGKSALTGGSSGPAQVWKVASGRGGRTVYPQGGRFTTASFSPDGKTIVTGDSKGKLLTWGTESGAAKPLGTHQGAVHHVVFDRTGKRLASAGADRTVMMWALDGAEGKALVGLGFEAKALAFSQDGKWLVAGGDDGAVQVFEVTGREPHWRASLLVKDGPELLTHNGWRAIGEGKSGGGGESWRKAAASARFGAQSPDGHLVCLVNGDKLELWDASKDQQVGNGPVTAVDDLRAFDNGCVLRAGQLATLLPVDGQTSNLSTTAGAIGVDGDQALLVEEGNLVTFARDGRRAGATPITPGATAVARGDGVIVLGFEGGVMEAIAGGRVVPFAGGPSARISRIVAGPARTFAAADANGFVGVWDGGSGRLLKQASLFARPAQLMVSGGTLYAVNERGGVTTFDLGTFAADYCAVLKDVWSRTPVLWAGGRAVPQAPPAEHRCR